MVIAMRRGIVFAALGALALLTGAPSAIAAQSATDDLNPPPPTFLTCTIVGEGTICSGTRERVEEPVDTGIVCGDGAEAFHIFDQGVEHQRLTIWYDGEGNIERVLNHERWTSASWSNPLTRAAVPYTQSNIITTDFAVAGDFNSATETTVGELIFTDPQTGRKVLRTVGRSVLDPEDGRVLFLAGKQPFFSGEPSLFEGLCAAVASQQNDKQRRRQPRRLMQ
ncbi:hypothetical protein GA0070613_5639 [Micromonospora inositola]|uniref:Uncharacterized protein n=2 Tax=Micromonospora inositola TaxID=47865 RepID=A0A1C5JX32_9ACTN|nr:hypothetical protein GA0070613_5639 [Micromonospora inositola]